MNLDFFEIKLEDIFQQKKFSFIIFSFHTNLGVIVAERNSLGGRRAKGFCMFLMPLNEKFLF